MESAEKNKCPHGRQKSRCKDCGGSGICEHGREKRACKKCTGCPHGVLKRDCKDCGYGCPHGKRKSRCKECGGNGLCFHGIQKDQCKKCFLLGIRVSSICEHGKMKKNCRICRASDLSNGRGAVAGVVGVAVPDLADHDPFWNHHDMLHMDYDDGRDDMFQGVEGLRGEQTEAAAAAPVAATLDPRFVVQDGFIEEIPFANSDNETDDDFSGGKYKKRYTKRPIRWRQNNRKMTNKKMKKRKVTKRSRKSK